MAMTEGPLRAVIFEWYFAHLPNLGLAWAEPAWSDDSTMLFQQIGSAPRFGVRQKMIQLTSVQGDRPLSDAAYPSDLHMQSMLFA
jgi:hypothetical protein